MLRIARSPSIIALILYAFIAILMTYPIITQLDSASIGGDASDAYEMVRHTWWFQYALKNGQDIFWQTHFAYPDGFSGFTFQANLLQYVPPAILALVLPSILALNVTILIALTLNGWTMYWLVRYLLTKLQIQANDELIIYIPAIISGLVFMYHPTFHGHLFDGHSGLIVMWTVPLFLLSFFRFIDAETWSWRSWALAVFLFWLSPSGHMLQTIYVLMPIFGVWFFYLLQKRDWQSLWRLVSVGIGGGIVLLAFLTPVILETFRNSETYIENTQVRYSMDALALVSPSFQHPFWGNALDYPAEVLGVNLGEGSSYLGIVGIFFALIAIITQKASRVWLTLLIVSTILALGPLLKLFDEPVVLNLGEYQTFIPLPWALVQNLPGFNLARTPARFNFTIAIALAILVGYGAQWLWIRLSRQAILRNGIFALAVVIMLIDGAFIFTNGSLAMATRPAPQVDLLTDFRNESDVEAVFNVPWQHLLVAKDALYYQTLHEKPIIAGQLTRQTPVNPAKLNVMQSTLSPTLLRQSGADVVIVHHRRAETIGEGDLRALADAQLGMPIFVNDEIAVYRVPDTTETQELVIGDTSNTTDDREYTVDFYTPQAQWVDISATLSTLTSNGEIPRDVTISLNGVPVHYMSLEQDIQSHDFTFAIPQAGYYRVAFIMDNTCPRFYDEQILACRNLTVSDVTLTAIDSNEASQPISYEGIRLLNYAITQDDVGVIVRLAWQSEREIVQEEHVRFVHILNEDGELVAQSDVAIADMVAGDTWMERVFIPFTDLDTGTYSVRVGWYTFDGFVRFPVITSDRIGAQDNAPEIGQITWGE